MKRLTQLETFDIAMTKIISISHDELKRRDAEWKKRRARKKRSKAPSSSRAARV